ncbi:MAG: sensor signal transduction histidine kinase [Bacteroidetes bacterium]|nr:sensor signal transduction histidine kinase [Bacteroidota bacterium]
MNGNEYHKLLLKQVTKKYGDISMLPPEMQELLLTVSHTYEQYDRDIQLVERSLDLSSGEMKETYLKLEQKKQEIQTSNDALRRYAYIVSHDLKEPLRTISSYLQLIELRLGDKLDGEGREFINYSVSGVKRMKGMLEAVLNYSQLENRKAFMSVDLNTVFESSCENLNEAIHEAHAVIKRTPLPQVRGDKYQLIQLFQNLMQNSLKFRGQTQPQITIEYLGGNNNHIISFRDNGIGVEDHYRSQLFQMFKKLHAPVEYDGLGMGLAVCRRIMENHEGEINLDPDFHDGLKVDLRFPALVA